MKKFMKFVVLPIILVTGVVFAYMTYNNQIGAGGTEQAYNFILDHIDSRGKLVDMKNEIAVHSAYDIKFFLTDKEAKIEFGFMKMIWPIEEFTTREVIDKLKVIGIEMKKEKKTGRILLFYKDEEIQRWVS